jgi:hypothetical protein
VAQQPHENGELKAGASGNPMRERLHESESPTLPRSFISGQHTVERVSSTFRISLRRRSGVFSRERGDDLLEARIAAERVPKGEQLKHGVAGG